MNADDLGYDPEIDRGILEAHAHGLVTSATAMVDTPYATAALAGLEDGTTELMCHPGYAPSHARTSFGAEREVELRALCEKRAREALAEVAAVLGTFDDV